MHFKSLSRFVMISSLMSIFVVLAIIPFFVLKHDDKPGELVPETIEHIMEDVAASPSEDVVFAVPEESPQTLEETSFVVFNDFDDNETVFCNESYERNILLVPDKETLISQEFYIDAALDEAILLASLATSAPVTDMTLEELISALERAQIEQELLQQDTEEDVPSEPEVTCFIEESDEVTEEAVAEITESNETGETSQIADIKPLETTVEETTVPETTEPVITVPEETEPVTTETTVFKKYETSFSRDSEEVKVMAQCLKGEAGASHSDMQKAAVIWCILNRVDSTDRYYPDDIIGVVTQPYQFTGYHDRQPVREDLVDIVMDVLGRWEAEHRGEVNVGRVLPEDYLFFAGKTSTNYFRKTYEITDDTKYWDWSLPNPYDS